MASILIPNDGATSVGNWENWTPTWTNVTVGNGTVVARYQKIGKIVFAYIELTLGSTSSITGLIRFTLPITAIGRQTSWNGKIGDSGVANYDGAVHIGTTVADFYAINAGSTYATLSSTSGTVPFTWGANDFFGAMMIYEVA